MNGLTNSESRLSNLSETSLSWQIPPANLKLNDNEVHIWFANLDHDNLGEFEKIISDDEQIRANRFKFEIDRNRFIVGRALLRKILSKYLQIDPCDIRFKYSFHGKPFLREPSQTRLKFNLSHSDKLALFAIASDQEVGIDIEQINPFFVDDGTISLCLTQTEKAHFQSLSDNERNLFFFDCWTHKEAYLKAHGSGLTIPPNEIETSDLQKPQLTFPKLPIIEGYAAALAVEGNHPRLNFWLQEDSQISQ